MQTQLSKRYSINIFIGLFQYSDLLCSYCPFFSTMALFKISNWRSLFRMPSSLIKAFRPRGYILYLKLLLH
jgi:hypothetical protein